MYDRSIQMVDGLQYSERFGGGGRPHTRKPHRYENYQEVHANQMNKLREAEVVVSDDLEFEGGPHPLTRADGFLLSGSVYTKSGGVLEVTKWLQADERGNVLSKHYRYHARLETHEERNLFRFDNCHENSPEKPVQSIHLHRFNVGGYEVLDPLNIPHLELPWMQEIIESVEELAANSAKLTGPQREVIREQEAHLPLYGVVHESL